MAGQRRPGTAPQGHANLREDRAGLPGPTPIGHGNRLDAFHSGSLEKLLASGRFGAQADKLLLYKSVATMDRAAPLPPLRNQKPTWPRAAKLARGWDLNKLAERLEALASQAG